MPVTPSNVAFAAVGFAVFFASLWLWPVVIARKINKPTAPLVPWSPRRSVPWAFIDFFLLVGLWILASVVVRYSLKHLAMLPAGVDMENPSPDARLAVLIGNTAVSLSILGLGLPLIGLRTGASPRDFGFSLQHVLDDLRLGLIGFILLAPPVYALQGLLVKFWKPSHHPLVELFQGAPDPLLFGLLFVSAAIVAPVFEELIFRVLWQGFIEKWFTFAYTLHQLFLGNHRRYETVILADYDSDVQPAERLLETKVDDPKLYAPPLGEVEFHDETAPTSQDEQPELRGMQAGLPIVISSTVFALLHYSHGPDWMPLFFLASGMGYLYQRTHRLLPSFIVHCLLNSYSLWGLWIQVHTDVARQ